MALYQIVLHVGHFGQNRPARYIRSGCQMSSLTERVNEDFNLIHHICRAAVT